MCIYTSVGIHPMNGMIISLQFDSLKVVTHLVVNALYSTVNSRTSLDQLNDSPITDGQWDMMIAVGERLCSLHDGNYDTHLKQMTQALLLQ